jgi:hypothetical protein
VDGSETIKEVNAQVQGAGPGVEGRVLPTCIKLIWRAKWLDDGRALELTRQQVYNDGTVSETDSLELADNSKTLNVKSSSDSTSPTITKRPGGSYVYTKK